MSLNIFMVAGEASADAHGAALLRELRRQHPDLRCSGVGDELLAREGMKVIADAKALNVVGISDWFDRFRGVLATYRHVCTVAKQSRPDCAILLDLPDFNLRLARKLKAWDIPVVYYISPQVWAWRKYRIHTIRRVVDRMLVVFPFEKPFYEKHGVSVEFVGHPLLETIEARSTYRDQSAITDAPRFAALPGSRHSELKYHAPVLAEVISRLFARYPKMEVRIPTPTTLSGEVVRKAFPDERIRIEVGGARAVQEWSDAAIVASGTATLETALAGTPFSLMYIVSPSSGFILKHFVRYRGFFGMPNLLHAREVVKEFLQEKATPESLFAESVRLIEDTEYRASVTRALRGCREKLGLAGASSRAASQVLGFIAERRREPGLGIATPSLS